MPRTVRLSKSHVTTREDVCDPEVASPEVASPEVAPPEVASPEVAPPDVAPPEDPSVREATKMVERSDVLLEKARLRFMNAYDTWLTKHGDAVEKQKLAEDALTELEESLI